MPGGSRGAKTAAALEELVPAVGTAPLEGWQAVVDSEFEVAEGVLEEGGVQSLALKQIDTLVATLGRPASSGGFAAAQWESHFLEPCDGADVPRLQGLLCTH